MKRIFLLVVLMAALAYTYWALAQLSFLSSTGRLGPGFFPRIIGIGLVAACLYALVADRGAAPPGDEPPGLWRPAVAMALVSGAFVALLDVLGGFVAMVAFLLVALSILNRGRWWHNRAVSLVLPIAVYALFDVWLNASMPRGILPLPV